MARAVEMRWNSKISAEYIIGPKMDALLHEKAEQVAETARSMAASFRKTGAYQNSIRVEKAPSSRRIRWRVIADVQHAGKVEAKHGTLGKALRANQMG